MISGYYRAHGLIRARSADTNATETREELENKVYNFQVQRNQHDLRNPRFELTFYDEDYYEIHLSFRISYKDRNADIDEYVEELLHDLESVTGIIVTDFEVEQIVPEKQHIL